MSQPPAVPPPARVKAILDRVQGSKILDVGCADHVVRPESPYWVHAHLRTRFPDVWGLDLSEENVGKMGALGYANVHAGSAESFTLAARFDTIVAGEIIEHLSNAGNFLDRAREHLAPGGRLVLSTPSPFGLLNLLYAWLKYPKTCQNDQHTGWFCPTTLRQLVERHGYTVESLDLIEDYEDGNPSRAYRMFVRLVRIFRFLIPARARCNDIVCVLTPRARPSG